MLSKKLAIAAASAALMLGAFAPMAFADVSVNNSGFVTVDSTTQSNSGLNNVSANDEGSVEDVTVNTGASVASSTVGTELNSNTVTVNGNDGMPDVDVRNCGMVAVEVTTQSNSGLNNVSAEEDGASVDGATVNAGAATAASNVQSLVNVNSVTVNGNNLAWED